MTLDDEHSITPQVVTQCEEETFKNPATHLMDTHTPARLGKGTFELASGSQQHQLQYQQQLQQPNQSIEDTVTAAMSSTSTQLAQMMEFMKTSFTSVANDSALIRTEQATFIASTSSAQQALATELETQRNRIDLQQQQHAADIAELKRLIEDQTL